MRAAPTLSYSGAIDLYVATSPFRITSTVAAYTAFDQVLWQVASSGMTAGQGAVAIASNDNTAFVALTAEL